MSGYSFGPPTQQSGNQMTLGSTVSFGASSGGSVFGGGMQTPGNTSGISFGAPAQAAQPAGGLTFGSPAAGATSSGLGAFGTPSLFGSSSFGTKPAAPPAFGGPTATVQPTLSFGASVSSAVQPSYGFGSTATPTQPGLTFGSAAATQPGLSFGSTAATQPGLSFGSTAATQPGLSFGAAGTTQPTLGFGAAAATQPTLSFGSPATTQSGITFGAPAAKTPQLGLGFGTNTAVTQPTLSFGTPATSQPNLSFGAATTTAQPTLSFGVPATSAQPTLSFGAPATSQPSLSFGASAAAQPSLSFGASAPAQPSLSIGTAVATSAQPALTFNASAASTQPSLSFGAPATSAQSSLSFGANPAVTTQPALSFGAPATTTQTGISFGTGIQSTPLTFGTPNKQPVLLQSTPLTAVTPASTATTVSGTLFGAPGTVTTTSAVAASTTATGLSFGAPKPTTSSFTFGGSGGTGTFGSTVSAATTPATATTTTTTTTPFKGLGGVDNTQNILGGTAGVSSSGRKEHNGIKENLIPNEILQTIEGFKAFVKQQKNLSCEVARASSKPMKRVTENTASLLQLVTGVRSGLQHNRMLVDRLKAETTKCLSDCEVAQRTQETPAGLQADNTAPLQLFQCLAERLDHDVAAVSQEIANTDRHILSLSSTSAVTPQELSAALRRVHDSLVGVAGRLQTVHVEVAAQKENHLALRRTHLKDATDVFGPLRSKNNANKTQQQMVLPAILSQPTPGPTPFHVLNMPKFASMTTQEIPPPAFPSNTASFTGWGMTPTTLAPTNTSILGGTTTGGILSLSQQSNESLNFQLKPPPGNKRGKR